MPDADTLIRALPASAADDTALVTEVSALVNQVYGAAEAGMWKPGTPRTSPGEIAEAIRAGEVVVADDGENVIGVVRTSAAERVGWFGMLAVHPTARSAGLGRRLVDACEELATNADALVMQIEVLTPLDGTNASKVELDRWYARLGYRHLRDDDLADHHPTLSALLATPCTLRAYRKPLAVVEQAVNAYDAS